MANGTALRMRSWSQFSTWGTPEQWALWLLVGLELGAQMGLRRYFKKQHGG